MSVLIKGMEMPKSCDECEFNHLFADAEWCDFLDNPIDITVDMGKERPKDCPIIPLPEKHGYWNETKGIFECSECGYSFEHEGYKHYFNFCPCCGAKMESE